MKILVTGAAGFIGYFVSEALLSRGDTIVGIDNLNAYYDPSLKQARLDRLSRQPNFRFEQLDLADRGAMAAFFGKEAFERVVHLAAQAGVRYSITNPHAYVESNLAGFVNVLEGCRHGGVRHLVYASTSSVYGANETLPFSVHDNVDHPVSLYAATKKANELMAHTYAHLYGLPVTGLRFFTVYGPWGRPDMAYFTFTRKILAGEPIEVFNEGRHARDFTYVDDITDGIVRALDHIAAPNPSWSGKAPDPATSRAPYRLYNIGNRNAVELMDFIAEIEKAVGRKAEIIMKPMQPGDVERTFADIADLSRDTGFSPRTNLGEGIPRFVTWYRDYYGV